MPTSANLPMYPFNTCASRSLSYRVHTLAAAAALAVVFLLLSACPASAAVAPASVVDDPPRQSSENTLTPPALTAAAVDGAIELRWDPVPGAVRYELQVWWDPLPDWKRFGGDGTAATAYTHTGLTAGREYYYTIRAVDAAGQKSGWQQEFASATVPAAPDSTLPATTPTLTPTPTPTATPAPLSTAVASRLTSPLTPPALTAAAVDGAIELRWDPVPGAVRYELKVWWDPLPDWEPIGGDDTAAAAYTHTGLTAGRKYYYTIRAVDAAGQKSGWQQDFASATVPAAPASTLPAITPTPTSTPTPVALPSPTLTPTPTATPAPTSTAAASLLTSPLTPPLLTAAVVDDAIELRWDPVPGAVRYELQAWWYPLPDWERFGGDDITATAYTHTGLTAGRKYYYTIRAVDAAGERSDWQQEFASATVPAAPGGALPTPTPTPTTTPVSSASPTPTPTPTLTLTPTPTAASDTSLLTSPLIPPALTAAAVDDAIELRWDPVPGAVRYELQVWWYPLPKWEPFGGDDITATAYTHTGLTVGRKYYYTVRAVNAAGETSDWQQKYASATAQAAPADPDPPRIGPPPASLDLDPFYRKYLDAEGIPVVASSNVDDAELYHAREIILAMLANRPDILAAMTANGFRVIIYENDGCRGPFQVPELREDLPPGRCTKTVGIARIRGLANRFTGEVLLVIEAIGVAPAYRPYCNFVFVHEFAHLVDFALTWRLPRSTVFDSRFDSRVENAYNAAMAAGLYPDAYAATGPHEYWAEAVTFWFLPDMLTGLVRTPANVSELADYDPRVVGLVEEVFGDAALPDCNPVFFRALGTVTGPGGNPLSGITVTADVRVVPRISPFYWYFIKGAAPTTADGAYVISVSKPRLAAVRRLVRRETGESDLDSHFFLAVTAGQASACPAGYLSSASGKVENIRSRSAAQFAIPRDDLSGISLTIAPNFAWTQQACLRSDARLAREEN